MRLIEPLRRFLRMKVTKAGQPGEIEFADRAGFQAALKACGLGDHAAQIAALGRTALFLKPAQKSQAGRSKIGGMPDLPEGVEWPVRAGYSRLDHNGNPVSTQYLYAPDGMAVEDYHFHPQPLDFIAQIDLAEMAGPASNEAGLPQSGMLYFFYDVTATPWGYDPRDAPGNRVIYHGAQGPLRPVTPPPEIAQRDTFPETRVSPLEIFSIPSPEGVEHLLPELPPVAHRKYWDAFIDVLRPHRPASALHQLVGLPDEIQHPMEEECALVSGGIYCGDPSGYQSDEAKGILARPNHWQLLLQIDTDDNAGMMWGDCGRLYWWIRRRDLEARDFSKGWMILQCS